MNMESLLKRLKLSLPLTSAAYDELLISYLQDAVRRFDVDITDESGQVLVILYAGWLWRSQQTPGLAMPPALRAAINDRTVTRAVGGGGDA